MAPPSPRNVSWNETKVDSIEVIAGAFSFCFGTWFLFYLLWKCYYAAKPAYQRLKHVSFEEVCL